MGYNQWDIRCLNCTSQQQHAAGMQRFKVWLLALYSNSVFLPVVLQLMEIYKEFDVARTGFDIRFGKMAALHRTSILYGSQQCRWC